VRTDSPGQIESDTEFDLQVGHHRPIDGDAAAWGWIRAASTTAVDLAGRFGPAQFAGIEEGIGEIVGRVMRLLPAARRAVLRGGMATIDLDGTDVECYGVGKEAIAYNYKGARAGRPHVATWAEAGVVTRGATTGRPGPAFHPGAPAA
jgi:hypothetical protein